MPDRTLLEAFATPSVQPFVIEHISDEFTSVCPMTGHPDFASVVLRYQPAAPGISASKRSGKGRANGAPAGGCVELKSLKMYYQSFRNEGIYYEAVTNTIRDDLARMLMPVWLQIVTHWRGRGGIRSVIRAEHGKVPEQWKTL